MSDVDDDTCIALAVLHGAEFFLSSRKRWYVDDRPFKGIESLHPVEQARYRALENERGSLANWGWLSRADVARDYCTFYGLI